ncbi:MAG: PAM68 family protein [Rivularia sp. (in: cyanobacteria)]
MSAESERNRLPFEPNKKRQKPAKANAQTPIVKEYVEKGDSKKPPFTKQEMAIPQAVSQRMVRRVAWLSGIPTVLGILTLIVSYLLIIYADIKLPPLLVLLVNMGLFGLGVLGITYGVLSASWEEQRAGTLLGWSEFTTNFGRMVTGWRETRQKKV